MSDIETFEFVEMPESDDTHEFVWHEMFRKLKAKEERKRYQQQIQNLWTQNKNLQAKNEDLRKQKLALLDLWMN